MKSFIYEENECFESFLKKLITSKAHIHIYNQSFLLEYNSKQFISKIFIMISYNLAIYVYIMYIFGVTAKFLSSAEKTINQDLDTSLFQMEPKLYEMWFNEVAPPVLPGSYIEKNDTVQTNLVLGHSWRLLGDAPYYHYHTSKVDDNCNTYTSVFHPFTGFRIFQQVDFFRLSRKVDYKTTIIYCENGIVTSSSTISNPNNQIGINDEEIICIDEHKQGTPNTIGCYKIAYRKSIPEFFPWFRSESFVAYLFRCPDVDSDKNYKCTNKNASPIGPLIGDEPYMALADIHNPARYGIRIPTFYVPDTMNYIYPVTDYKESQYIDIDSNYSLVLASVKNTHPMGLPTFIETKTKNHRFALEILKRHVPITDEFVSKYLSKYNFLTKSKVIVIKDLEHLSSLGLYAISFMKDRQKARRIYEKISREIHPIKFDLFKDRSAINDKNLMGIETAIKIMNN